MNLHLKDIIDLPVLQTMLDSLWRASGIPLGIIDAEGEVLISTGWQKICTEYHRKHPDVGQRCLLNRLIEQPKEDPGFSAGEPLEFTCVSGLVDIGLPLYFEESYLGTLFLGQFLYEKPDQDRFREQGERFGCDPDQYLEMLTDVPVIPKDKVKDFLQFHESLVTLLTEMGMHKLREEIVRSELEESEQTFRSLFANANDGIAITGIDGRILEANPAICDLLGYPHEEFIGLDIRELADPSVRDNIPARITQIMKEGSVLFDTILLHKDGHQVPIGISCCLLQYRGQQALLGNIRDLSERKTTEKALQESEHRFRTFFESAAVGMASTDKDGNFLQVNPQLCEFLGYQEEELLKLKISDVTAPEDREQSVRLIQDATDGVRPIIDMEKRYLRKDGKRVWGRVTAAYLEDVSASGVAAVAMVQDVSQRKVIEEALKASEESLRSIIDATPLGIHLYILDNDRLIFTGYNPAADEILGVDNSQFIGKEITEAFPALRDTEIPENYRKVFLSGDPWKTESFIYQDEQVGGSYEVYAFKTGPGRMASLFLDVTERQKAIEAVRTSEAALKGILTAAPMSIGLVRNRVFGWVNRWMCEELGYSEDELIGRKATMLYESETEFKRVGEVKYAEVTHGRMGEVQTRWVCKNGDVIDVLLRSMAINPNDLDVGVIFTGLNITELKRSTEELHDKEEQVRLLLNSSGEAVYGVDHKGDCTFVNPMCLELLGYANEDDLLGKSSHGLFHYKYKDGSPYPDDECKIYKAFRFGESVHEAGEVFWRKDGTCFPVEYWSYPIVKNEKIVGSVVNFIDITERQKADDELRQALNDARHSREQVDAILRSAADGMIVTDLRGDVILVNDAAEALLGQNADRMTGALIETILTDQDFLERVALTLAGEEQTRPLDLAPRGGEEGYEQILQARIAAMRGEDDFIDGSVITLRDVTRDRELDQLKDEFISTAAHELRTPMTSILGYSELILDSLHTFGEEQLKEFVEIINERSTALSKIIGDMLDLSRVQSGHLIAIEPFPGELGDTLKQAITPYERDGGQHAFMVTVPEELPDVVYDAGKIAQVLDNLISNSVKFSPGGGTISLEAKPCDDRVEVMIRDEGIGMSPAEKERVFDKFFRADSSNTAVSGLGLGMSLVKGIIEAHGGKIWVESEPGIGTTVVFSLPVDTEAL